MWLVLAEIEPSQIFTAAVDRAYYFFYDGISSSLSLLMSVLGGS